jgi:type I restriction enzyme R subunit
MSTDISEKGLESLIVRHMTGTDGLAVAPGAMTEPPAPYGGTGYFAGSPKDFDRAHALDVAQLFAFLRATQPEAVKKLAMVDAHDAKDLNRLKFLSRLSAEVGKRGVIDVLRKGIEHHPAGHFDLFYGTPSEGNAKAAALHAQNRFSVTRQLAYSTDESRRALDLGLFINGLPIATFELKNSLTKQTVEDAVEQYRRDRNPRERLFEFGRCVVHFAVDDAEVRMCTELKGKASWFLPFNKGHNDGAGNPPNPTGLKTDYLWKEMLTPAGLTDILENYAQIVEVKHPRRARRSARRFSALSPAGRGAPGPGRCARARRRQALPDPALGGQRQVELHRLAGAPAHRREGRRQARKVFDSVIVITDRRILDDQIRRPSSSSCRWAPRWAMPSTRATCGGSSSRARRSSSPRCRSSRGYSTRSARWATSASPSSSTRRTRARAARPRRPWARPWGRAPTQRRAGTTKSVTPKDVVNAALEARMAARKMLTNASYFAFTATPKNKTLEMFGEPLPPDAEGKVKHKPFHHYSMKQAVQERFILDVLENYVPVDSYYKLIKKIEDDPEFDTKKAKKKLRRYVESHDHAIRLKAEIMVDHFHEQVLAAGKIGGQARAMVVTSGIERAVQYFHAMKAYLVERKSPYQAIVAFSGEHEFGGAKVSEASLNGFPSKDIADKIQDDPYRFLICADKFQTGYDEPLLHTMYVDKALSGVKAVQTLSRLNRAHPQKHDCFVLDFQNNSETITLAFQDYYRATLLAEETDPNKLHDLKAALDGAQVYSPDQVQQFAALFLAGAERDQLDPILDACVAAYTGTLDEDQQVDFKGKAKVFCRTYDFLASVMPGTNPEWEKLSILLNLLVSKLPAPKEEDLAKGILEAIDMDSYRVEKKALMKIALADADAEIAPVPTDGGGRKPEPELDRLSNILKTFNDNFGTLFDDTDRVAKRIRDDIAPKVAADKAFQNARENTPHTARMAHDQALGKVMQILLKDDTQVYKQFVENESFRRFVGDMVYQLTSQGPSPLGGSPAA